MPHSPDVHEDDYEAHQAHKPDAHKPDAHKPDQAHESHNDNIGEVKQKLSDLKEHITEAHSLSEEDKESLNHAVGELEAAMSKLKAGSGGKAHDPDKVKAYGEEGAPTGMPGSSEQATANGPSNHPAGGSAPLMPTSAFDPNPTGTLVAMAEHAGATVSSYQGHATPVPGGFVLNPPTPRDPDEPVDYSVDVAPSSVVPNVHGGRTILAGQVAPGAAVSAHGGVESATGADGAPLDPSAPPTDPNAPPPSTAVPHDGEPAPVEHVPHTEHMPHAAHPA